MVFFTILKVLGIILLSILAILLLLIILLMFCPVSYRIKARGNSGDYFAEFKAKWLFGIVGFSAGYKDEDIWVWYRIFFHKKDMLEDDEDDVDEDAENDDKEDEENKADKVDKAKDTEKADEVDKEDEVGEDEIGEEDEAEEDEAEKDVAGVGEVGEDDEEFSDESDADNSVERIISYIKSILKFTKRIKKSLSKFCKKISIIYKKYTRISNSPRYRKAIEHLKVEFKKLMKAIRPSYFKADAMFSAGAPDRTGKLLGCYSILPFVYKNKGKVVPDFTSDNIYIEGDVIIKGRILLIKVILIVLRVWLDKNCHKLYNYITR